MTAEVWDVVVVGAGLSGLSAAHLLKKRNDKLRILILEGKDRVGGRTVTKELPASDGVDRWDLGGQWVGSTQTHIMEVIQELGLEIYPQYNIGKKVHHMGGPDAKVRTYSTSIPALSPVVLMDLSQFLWKIDRLCATVCTQDPSRTPNAVELDSMTFHSYIEQHAWTRELKEEMQLSSRAVFGIEPSQMSFLFFLVYSAAAGGVLALLESTPGSAQEFKVKDAEWATVKTDTRSFLCRAVIVTCPPHLAAKIHYKPSLPHQREFLTQNMPVGHMIKFIITYQTAFWREKGLSGEIVAQPSGDCPLSVTFDATSPGRNAALVGFIAGLQASEWSCREAGERMAAVVASLVKYLGPEAASFIHYEEKDWAKEEYNGGCPVNVMAPGLLTYYHPSLRRPCGRIHWAGTETATQWCGYMSGAVQAGQRAAMEVLAELWPSTLTQEEQEAQRHSQGLKTTPSPPSSSSMFSVRRAVLIAALTMATALVLSRSEHHRKWITQSQDLLRRCVLATAKYNIFQK
ncbi:putative flavin-containing monoamine oxidase A isoform 2-T2 [Polymixia lowei]